MADFPGISQTPMFIHSWTDRCNGRMFRNGAVTSGLATFTWGTTNMATFIPLHLPWPYYVARCFWVNGSTASGNIDMSIYTLGGGKVWATGSVARSGTSTPQFSSVNLPIMLPAGRYFLGFASSGTTNQGFGSLLAVRFGRSAGYLARASSIPFPAASTTITYSAYNGDGVPLCGITRLTTGF